MKALDCVDCHMPDPAKSATSVVGEDDSWACRTCHNASPTGTIFPVSDGLIDGFVYHNNIVP
jgi:hypothetical protein